MKPFGSDTKTFSIEQRRPEKIQKTPGPGEYNFERATSVTKVRNPTIRLESGKKRPDNFTKQVQYRAEPGEY